MGLEAKVIIKQDNSKELQRVYSAVNYTKFLRAVADDLIQEMRGWAKYYIYNTAPSPHYRRTWRLYNTIGAVVRGNGDVRLQSGVEYAEHVHEGTRHMSPRPYMHRALKDFEAIIEKNAVIYFGKIERR